MKIRLVKTLKGGEKLAEPVITKENDILISEGTILKPEYLEMLFLLGIETVCIKDPYEEFEKPHWIVSIKKKEEYTERIQEILEKHIYQKKNILKKIGSLAEEIVGSVDGKENTVYDMIERNGNLYEHTIMVTLLSLVVAKKMGIRGELLYQIALGSLLHDLGLRYITVPYINRDISQYTASEIFEFKKHPILAYTALEDEEWLPKNVKRMILFHHERRNGTGYPLKQKRKEIECNILQVCDAFDCHISGIECRRIGIRETLEYMDQNSDVLFDGKIVKELRKFAAFYPVGTKVALSTGEWGIVTSQTEDPKLPVVRIIDETENLTEDFRNTREEKKISILGAEY